MMRVLHVTDPNAPTDPDPWPPGMPQPCEIEAFKLWDADKDVVVKYPYYGYQPVCKEGFEFSIEAVAPSPTCSSVRFELKSNNGYSYTHTETTRLWTLWGNDKLNVYGRLKSIPAGSYNLTAFGDNTAEIFEKTITFEVKKCDVCEITHFELWDATTNAFDSDLLFNQDNIICNNKFGQYGISIKALAPTCNRVVFEVTGVDYFHDQTENNDPYFAWANSGSNVFGEVLDAGNYTVSAFGDGEPSLEKTITITVIENCSL